ncbi:MAG: hypothetical protein Q8K36_06590, partial [Alphaproteobacteria bacterium]|nr:hypothetical protein [Alphaproteobacteria bacterium]
MMKAFLVFCATISFLHAHKGCCDEKHRTWSGNLSVSATNTSSGYSPTNHHQGLSLDHSSVSVGGPLGAYFDASAAVAMHTSKKHDTRKVSLDADLEELSVKTTHNAHEAFSAKAGRFASYISPANQAHCCGAFFIKRPLLYRAFLGGHLIDNGGHIDYTISHSEDAHTTVGFESFHGKGLMSQSNKGIGLFAWMIRHKNAIHQNHELDLSVSYLLNSLYNQPYRNASNHSGCCQGSSFTGKHMMMANLALTSKIVDGIESNLSGEVARVSKLAERFGRNRHHIAYSLGSVISFTDLAIGTAEFGARYDYLRGIGFCPCGGPYLNKTHEKTAMIGWKPNENHTLRFEYTHQTLKE